MDGVVCTGSATVAHLRRVRHYPGADFLRGCVPFRIDALETGFRSRPTSYLRRGVVNLFDSVLFDRDSIVFCAGSGVDAGLPAQPLRQRHGSNPALSRLLTARLHHWLPGKQKIGRCRPHQHLLCQLRSPFHRPRLSLVDRFWVLVEQHRHSRVFSRRVRHRRYCIRTGYLLRLLSTRVPRTALSSILRIRRTGRQHSQ